MRRRVTPPLPTVRGVGPTRVRMPGPGAPDPVLDALPGLPATAMPVTMHEGLPIGVQVIADRYHDHDTIAVAALAASALGEAA